VIRFNFMCPHTRNLSTARSDAAATTGWVGSASDQNFAAEKQGRGVEFTCRVHVAGLHEGAPNNLRGTCGGIAQQQKRFGRRLSR
jgi:hypothetical protein